MWCKLFKKAGAEYCKNVDCPCPEHKCEVLAEAAEDQEVVITCNHHHQTLERGLYTGRKVRILRNNRKEPNLVLAVGDARYALDRRIAQKIRVKPVATS